MIHTLSALKQLGFVQLHSYLERMCISYYIRLLHLQIEVEGMLPCTILKIDFSILLID